jgi:hypothetical protein
MAKKDIIMMAMRMIGVEALSSKKAKLAACVESVEQASI